MAERQPTTVRLRRMLGDDLCEPRWADGFSVRTVEPGDAQDIHALFSLVFADTPQPFEAWWSTVSGDDEFDPNCFFVVHDQEGKLVASALAWTSAYLKDLAVYPAARRNGLAEALFWQVLALFKERGATHVDLKTDTSDYADAVRLYRRLGMVEVDWEG